MATVSVLIRSYGRQGALAESIASVKLQTFKDYEIIVVEDGQETLGEFLSRYKDMSLYYLPSLERKSKSAASNAALALAKGEYCIFMDEGNLFYPEHLEGLMARVKESGCNVVYSWSEEVAVTRSANGAITKVGRRRWRRENFSLLHMVAGEFMPTCTVLFHRSFFERTEGFDYYLFSYQDQMFWLRVAALDPQWECVPRATAMYHVPYAKAKKRKNSAKPVVNMGLLKMEETMATLPIAWPMLSLRLEMKQRFKLNLFLRKWYYYLSSFIR